MHLSMVTALSIPVGRLGGGIFLTGLMGCFSRLGGQANQCSDENAPGMLASKVMDKIDSGNAGSSVLLVVK